MILTCPACDTKYVVKDGAIPPGGRQVRCASCKHSWHQEPETLTLDEGEELTADEQVDFGGPPLADPEGPIEQQAGQPTDEAVEQAYVAGEPQPEPDEEAEWEAAPDATPDANADAPRFNPDALLEQPAEEDFAGYDPIEDEPARRRAWPLLVGLLLMVALAAAAFWFLAPDSWRAKAGIAGVGGTPLQLMITTSDRQPLESGNELVAISGRVINPTDEEQLVPPIRAELRDKQTRAVVHRWTIAPPAERLAPRSSASFNSAEVDVPKGGDELTITLGG